MCKAMHITPEASLEAVKFDRDCVGSQAVLGRFARGELGTPLVKNSVTVFT